MKKHFAILLLAIPLLILGGGQAYADTPAKVITVSPATAKPSIKPGQTIHDSFRVINQGNAAFAVTIYATPYGVHGEEYTPDFAPVANKPAVNSWIRFETTQASIEKGKTTTINYSISVPAGTEPGGYYAVAFVQSKSEKKGVGVVVNQRVGEVFYIQVAGKVRQAGKIASWNVAHLQAPSLRADLRLENQGGVHYASNTRIQVKDVLGRTKYSLTTNKEVLPQTIRHIPFSWEDAPPLGLFKVTGTTHLPSGDVQLPAKYVLVMTTLFRVIFGCIVAAVLLVCIARFVVGKRKAASRSGR